MLMGHSISLYDRNDSGENLSDDAISEVEEVEAEFSAKVLCRASFEELARNYVQYDTIIWVLISLLLVLAWGVGFFMLLYLPVRRYVLQKDISSRKLYITPHEIVYMVTRLSILPCIGYTNIKKCIPLHLVIDVIIEQGCLQAVYGIHTFRVGSIARGKASPVDELQIQGVSNPELLRKVIVSEAAKNFQEIGICKSKSCAGNREYIPTHMGSVADIPPFFSFTLPSSNKVLGTPRHTLVAEGVTSNELLLQKLEEVTQSVKKLESLVRGQTKAAYKWEDVYQTIGSSSRYM